MGLQTLSGVCLYLKKKNAWQDHVQKRTENDGSTVVPKYPYACAIYVTMDYHGEKVQKGSDRYFGDMPSKNAFSLFLRYYKFQIMWPRDCANPICAPLSCDAHLSRLFPLYTKTHSSQVFFFLPTSTSPHFSAFADCYN